jgi:cytochrome c556
VLPINPARRVQFVNQGAVYSPGQKNNIVQTLSESRLKNARRFAVGVICGGMPENEEAFAALRELEVKTIISVSGSPADTELARRYGMLCVHLPTGFSGLTDLRGLEIARAVHDNPEIAYICADDGSDRAPAAAAVVCVVFGTMTPEKAVRALKSVNVPESSKGLYAWVAAASKVESEAVHAVKIRFHEKEDVGAVTKAMVALGKAGGRLQAALSGDPKVQAGKAGAELVKTFAELRELQDVTAQSEEFRRLLTASQTAAAAVSEAAGSIKVKATPEQLGKLETGLQALNSSCAACHSQYRDDVQQNAQIGKRVK